MDLIWNGNRLLVPGGGLHIGWNDTPPQPSIPQVTIGTQTWMSKNLDVSIEGTTYPNTSIYNNDEATIPIYGRYYDGIQVPAINALYPGWHVPTKAEFLTLISFLGATVGGGKLKATGTTYWNSPNAGATNEYGFNALAASRWEYNWNQPLGQYAWFLSSTYENSGYVVMYLTHDSAWVNTAGGFDGFTYSVRLIKNT